MRELGVYRLAVKPPGQSWRKARLLPESYPYREDAEAKAEELQAAGFEVSIVWKYDRTLRRTADY